MFRALGGFHIAQPNGQASVSSPAPKTANAEKVGGFGGMGLLELSFVRGSLGGDPEATGGFHVARPGMADHPSYRLMALGGLGCWKG